MGKWYPVRQVQSVRSPYVDGLFGEAQWGDTRILYSFPSTRFDYDYHYLDPDAQLFWPVSARQKAAARFALDMDDGNAANNGFSVEGFTALTIGQSDLPNAHLRYANYAGGPNDTAYAYYPGQSHEGYEGDLWFANSGLYPTAGNYDWHAILHETGHALGLKHPHEYSVGWRFGPLPVDRDSPEYTVMTYRSYLGGSPYAGSYTMSQNGGFPQSYMMLDILALQWMYGANYGVNAGNTVYYWVPSSGGTYVNGGLAITPVANRIFATIWDGGGTDTYHLASYATPVTVDLRPGYGSVFSTRQLADLGDGRSASGNIYNAMLFNGDTRSLIENVYGGSAGDVIIGNDASNVLAGFAGNDRIWGMQGDDFLIGGAGADILYGVIGFDYAHYWGSPATVVVRLDTPPVGGRSGQGSGRYGDAEGDVLDNIDGLIGSAHLDYLIGNASGNAILGGGGGDQIYGLGGDDTLNGQDGNDWIRGNGGNDLLIGGAGADAFVFDTPLNPNTNLDTIRDFQPRQDTIWLDDGVMPLLGAAGSLANWAFLLTGTGQATTQWQRVIYNWSTGLLSYDADGSGATAPVALAQLNPQLGLTSADFFVF